MITSITPNSRYWQLFLDHLREARMKQHIEFDNNDYIYIVKIVDEIVVAHITIKKQLLEIPTLNKQKLYKNDKLLYEYYVQTFFVNADFRNKGIGSSLQEHAYQLSCENDAYQMRSWSSYDKKENYIVKIKLGFSIHPGHTYVSKTNQYIPGAYFIKKC